MASLHVLFKLDVEADAVWVAVLELENSSEVHRANQMSPK